MQRRVSLPFFVAYIGILHSPLAAQSIPAKLVECEANRCDGAWTFRGQEGNAQWDGGIRATLKVERYDADRILIRRTDTAGPTPGLTALYEGMMRGDRIEGDVTWSWPGHWDKPVTGRWSATIDTKPAQTGETGHPPVAPTDQRAPVSGQIVATLTGTIGVLHDNLGVFGGGSYFGKSAGATRLGPPVRLVFTWHDTGEPFEANCDPPLGIVSSSPPAATVSAVITIGADSFTFGTLPNFHAKMRRTVEGRDPHLTSLWITTREGGPSMDSDLVLGSINSLDVRIGPGIENRIGASCDWRQSLSSTVEARAGLSIDADGPGKETDADIHITSVVITGLAGKHDSPSSTAAQRANPILGIWRAKSRGSFFTAPDVEFTPTEEISGGKHYGVTYTKQGDTIYVTSPGNLPRTCTMNGPDEMTCSTSIITFDMVRVR